MIFIASNKSSLGSEDSFVKAVRNVGHENFYWQIIEKYVIFVFVVQCQDGFIIIRFT